MTRFFTVSTAGHVDHGKTSLLRALTGIDPDRLKEEKERQMTTDLGFAHLRLSDDITVGFVDVPGHGKFLKNMLAGVGGIDMALLVVAADEGPMPQTIQHVRILSLLGVTQSLVALNKIDAVQDEEHLANVKARIERMLSAHGMKSLGIVEVSAVKNVGIENLRNALARVLEDFKRDTKSQTAFLPIDRVFSKSGFGTVITGTLVRGELKVGDQINIEPSIATGRVRRLESFGKAVETATAGQRLACNVVIKDGIKLVRGNVITTGQSAQTKSIIALIADEPSTSGDKFRQAVEDHPVRLYHGTAEVHGRVRWAVESADAGGRSRLIAYISMDEALVAYPQDRFVIRTSDDTIYGGTVLMRDRPKWMKRDGIIAVAETVAKGETSAAVKLLIDGARQQMLESGLVSLILPPAQSIHSLTNGKITRLADLLMPTDKRSELDAALLKTIINALAAQTNEDSVSAEVIRTKMSPKLPRPAFNQLVDDNVAAGTIRKAGDKLALPDSASKKPSSAENSPLENEILKLLEESFCLDVAEMSKALKKDEKTTKTAVQSLAKKGAACLISYEFAISPSNLAKAHKVLADIWYAKRNITPTDFRESLGTSRKYAMALLQHFDDNRITRRLNEGRVLLKAPQ